MTGAKVVVVAEVRPTESIEKVRSAILNIIDPDVIDVEGDDFKRIVAISSDIRSLERLRRLLRVERILDAARGAMKKGLSSGRLEFYLHKQALYAGRLSFVSGDFESPLGAIHVVIEHPEPKKVLDWLAPPTSRGRPIFELDTPP